MAFHEVRLSDSISLGSSGGPGFSTSIVEGTGGASERISRWSNARRHYNAKPGIKTFAALTAVMDFYIARQGPAIGFRWKDHMDFTTAVNHRDAPSATDVFLANAPGSGSSGQFQLRTQYVSSPTTTYRTIRKPVANTTLMACNGVPLATTNYTTDTATGLVTVTAGLTPNLPVTGGCEFDVPVQFAAELDTEFDISIEEFNYADIPDIMLVEMVGDVTSPDRFYAGGGSSIAASGTTAINFGHGRALIYSGAGNATWLMPDPTDLELGGPYFYIYNFGTSTPTITVKTFDNVTTILGVGGVAPAMILGKLAILCVYNDGTANKWAALTT